MARACQSAWIVGAIVLVLMVLPGSARATTIVTNPVDDGTLYSCSACNHNPVRAYVEASGYIVGDVDFQVPALGGSITSAVLSVNPYGLPLFSPQVSVYGVASANPFISLADFASPTFLGILTLPPGLGFGQDTFFDVTSFLESVQTPYVDFILETPTGETDMFSSLQTNYGHPSQLTIITPEPSGILLLAAGCLALLLVVGRKLRSA